MQATIKVNQPLCQSLIFYCLDSHEANLLSAKHPNTPRSHRAKLLNQAAEYRRLWLNVRQFTQLNH